MHHKSTHWIVNYPMCTKHHPACIGSWAIHCMLSNIHCDWIVHHSSHIVHHKACIGSCIIYCVSCITQRALDHVLPIVCRASENVHWVVQRELDLESLVSCIVHQTREYFISNRSWWSVHLHHSLAISLEAFFSFIEHCRVSP